MYLEMHEEEDDYNKGIVSIVKGKEAGIAEVSIPITITIIIVVVVPRHSKRVVQEHSHAGTHKDQHKDDAPTMICPCFTHSSIIPHMLQ